MARIITIDDLKDPALAPYAALTERQLRAGQGAGPVFIAESGPVIEAALCRGLRPVSMLAARRHVTGKAAELIGRLGDVPVYTGEDGLLASLTGYELTRGVLCAFERPAPADPRALRQGARRLLILEDVFDAANMGAILRSAAALGMDAALLSPGCCDPLNRRAARVSMGAVCRLPWAFVPAVEWPGALLSALKGEGYTTWAMALREGALTPAQAAREAGGRFAVLLGNEGRGLTQDAIDACGRVIRIPMAHGVDSLNVAAAAAVAFYALTSEAR